MVDFDAFVRWAEDKFDGFVIVKGNEVKINSIFTEDRKFHLYCNVYGGKHKREDGVYHCWKTGNKGTLMGLVMQVEGCTYQEAQDILEGATSIRVLEERLHEFFENKQNTVTRPESKIKLPDETYPICDLSYLHRREAEDYISNRHLLIDGLYYCTGGEYRSRIIIPYYDKDGKLIYFNSRHVGKSKLRYMGPPKTCGVGKCFGINTPILMCDGSIKKIQDVQDDELVMGIDSFPRKVSGVTTGRDMLYRIIPIKGESYVVNSSHVLALENRETRKKFLITIKDFLKKSDNFQHISQSYRMAVNFPEQDVLIEPYVFGIWLGDGDSKRTSITNKDSVIIEAWQQEANIRGLKVNVEKNNYLHHHMVGRWNGKQVKNTLLFDLRNIDVFGNKHIPNCYLQNSRQVRLAVLAGYLDTDGCLSNNCYEFITKRLSIAEGITYLARSLGFACYFKVVVNKNQTGFKGTYYRGVISGHVSEIPVRIEYKKARERKINKNVLKFGFRIEPLGEGEYYGFAVDGDHLFLLGDFTVVHNSDVLFAQKWPVAGSKVYLTEGEFDAMTLNHCGLYGIACGGKNLSDKQLEMLRTYKVCLALDADNTIVESASPGLQGMMEMGRKLLSVFVPTTFVRPPKQFKDWNKMLVVLYNEEIVRAYINKCEKPFDPLTIEQLMCLV